MATLKNKLADSLEVLRKLQKGKSVAAFQTKDMSRTHLERLLKRGFIKSVMRGWYVSVDPKANHGETTVWFTSFWTFCSVYLQERFSDNWVVTPEQAILLHSGNWKVPDQLIVRTPKGHNNKTELSYGTSLFDLQYDPPKSNQVEIIDGIRLFSLPYALVNCSKAFFVNHSMDARTALLMIRDVSEILSPLLEGGHSKIAGRLAGAFRNIGRSAFADEIMKAFDGTDYDVREADPFENSMTLSMPFREPSSYVNRIHLLWNSWREVVINNFPIPPKQQVNIVTYMNRVEKGYSTDAYHSLSIEGYQVTPELIERVRTGDWDPEKYKGDLEQYNAMAARGYWQAFQVVKGSVEKVLSGGNSGEIVSIDHRDWYREMFTPSVTAGLLDQTDLAGYRNGPVYINNSNFVPQPREAVPDSMLKLFDLLINESESSVRVVLGHYVFVYIHPYRDGNGRMARFLMNVMLASGGYPWTIVPLEKRNLYMQALEEASVNENILPFTEFMAGLVSEGI